MRCPGLIYRAIQKRPQNVRNGYGAKDGTPAVINTALKLFYWTRSHRSILGTGKDATVEEIVAVFRADSDVKQGDRLESITDQRDRAVVDTPLAVDTVTLILGMRGSRFLQAQLKRVK